MTLRVALLALVSCWSLAPNAASAQASPPWQAFGSDMTPDPEVRFGTLPNGMRYAIRRNATPPGEASLRLRIDAGSLHEAQDQRGLAHFLEHMVLNGTTNVPEGEFVARLERHGLRFGPDTNARTEYGQTVYQLDLPETDDDTVDTSLFLLREVADEALLDAASINAERPVIQSEERTRATAQQRVLDDQLTFLLPGQLLPNRSPIGTREVIAGAARDRFLRFYHAYYRPERATLVAVGDFDVDAMERKIRERFSSWRGEGPAGRDPAGGAPRARQAETRILVEPGGPEQIVLNWVRPVRTGPATRATFQADVTDALAMRILNRRMERVAASATPPFIAAAGSRAPLADTADMTQLTAVFRPGEWQAALRGIEAEQRQIAEYGVTRAEVIREVDEVRATFLGAVTSAAGRPSADIAEELVLSFELRTPPTSARENLRLIDAVIDRLDVETISRAAREMFAGPPLIYVTVGAPLEGGEAAVLAAYHQARAVALNAPSTTQRAAPQWTYTAFGKPGDVVERRVVDPALNVTAVRFANGVRLTVKPTTFAPDQLIVSVRYGGGRLALPADRASPEWALGIGFPALGTGRLDYEDLQEALSGQAFSVNMVADDNAFQLIGATTDTDFDSQMQVMAAYVSDPGWRTQAWDRLRYLSGTIHDTLASTPGGVLTRDLNGLIHAGDRRFTMPTREELARGTLAEARAVLEPAFEGPIEVIVVGDVTVEEAIVQTASTFGAFPARAAAPARGQPARFPAPGAPPVRLFHGGRSDQALAYIAWPTTDFYSDPRRARALNILGEVYRLRLIQRVREEQGASYSPEADHYASETLPGYGVMAAQIEARPEAIDDFLRDAEEIAAALASNPISADELQRALRPRVERLQRELNGNNWWVANLAGIQTDRRVADSLIDLLDEYRSLTPEEVQRVAREYLRPATVYKIIVLPRGIAPAP